MLAVAAEEVSFAGLLSLFVIIFESSFLGSAEVAAAAPLVDLADVVTVKLRVCDFLADGSLVEAFVGLAAEDVVAVPVPALGAGFVALSVTEVAVVGCFLAASVAIGCLSSFLR